MTTKRRHQYRKKLRRKRIMLRKLAQVAVNTDICLSYGSSPRRIIKALGGTPTPEQEKYSDYFEEQQKKYWEYIYSQYRKIREEYGTL